MKMRFVILEFLRLLLKGADAVNKIDKPAIKCVFKCHKFISLLIIIFKFKKYMQLN